MKERKTCQCCGRGILANKGRIAHHGYQRPGIGWQTGSCIGALHLPFEVSRERLGYLIELIERDIHRFVEDRAKVEAESRPLRFSYVRRINSAWGKGVEHFVEVTRETFDMVREAYRSEMMRQSIHRFEYLKDRELSQIDFQLKNLRTYRDDQQKRFDGWRQTEEWHEGRWVPLATMERAS